MVNNTDIKIGVIVTKEKSLNNCKESTYNHSKVQDKNSKIIFIDREAHQKFVDNMFSIFK